jgi:glycerol-3-phosphate acyltransferase PlsY
VFVLDLLKSLLPMLAAGVMLRRDLGAGGSYDAAHYGLWLLVGLAAILGHVFSVYLGFRGGKGVATSAGVMLGLYPYYTLPAMFAIVAFALALLRWRYMSLASIVGAITFPLAYLCAGLVLNWPIARQQLPLLICAILMAGLVVLRHRANIARLRAGTERGISRSKE